MDRSYDVIVIGGGHAGIEAALAAVRLGCTCLLMSINLDSLGFLACNPSIGGTAKGHLVREIDALGGQMGIEADKAMLQLRMLNSSKGSAVQSLRAQVDKNRYHTNIKRTLEQSGVHIRQAEAARILIEDGRAAGVETTLLLRFYARQVIVCTGVYLNSEVITGDSRLRQGPSGFTGAYTLSKSLCDLGFKLRRFKTGTPARVDGATINYNGMDRQDGDNVDPFSFLNADSQLPYNAMPCYLCYTTSGTHEIIRDNLALAPSKNGSIKGTGARYCPSIEDKVTRFADKERHQLFLEPEGQDTCEVYIQGVSTSFGPELSERILNSIPGLENVRVMRDAYAIEYDCIDSLELDARLQSKRIFGLYFAGQINGTSGYEEAAAQGLIAGINAALSIKGSPAFTLMRDEGYIGVLIDDLVTKGTNEPYRMMTSRAEYRLLLRQDNADARLTERGRGIGLVNDQRYEIYKKKQAELNALRSRLGDMIPAEDVAAVIQDARAMKLLEIMKRPGINLDDIIKLPGLRGFSRGCISSVLNECKYAGYISRQTAQVNEQRRLEGRELPEDIDYAAIAGLRIEARQKLAKIMPLNLGQASRISGVSPADITVLILYLKARERGK